MVENDMKIYDNYPIDFSKQTYLPIITKIEYIQRRLIVACISYYELGEGFLSDYKFDKLSQQLLYYHNNYKETAKQSRYWYCLSDYDGSTGFYLFNMLDKYDKPYLKQLAGLVLKGFKNRGVENRT